MRPSRGMGDIAPSKVPKTTKKRDGNEPVELYKKGGKVGLYENIHKKQERIAKGSGEKMRKVGSKGAPTKQDFIDSAKTARFK
jgi:hypothetical protein